MCRDFARLAISVCRSRGIPARSVPIYADTLNPPDFHAVMEVYLQSPTAELGSPTHMASVGAVARIAAGRDAADVPFAWTLGDCDATVPRVKVTAPDRGSKARTTQAVVGV